MTRKVRTRIAPSPTGFLHLGTARTALFSWAYARHHGGEFVLRIEDTDVARSTQDSVDQILASMHWLGLDYDEGPIYQMQRLERYNAVIDSMLTAGTAYRCYCTPSDLDEMREAQRARGEKTHYNGRWRPEPGKVLPAIPAGVQPVVRFRNPIDGDVSWDDLVKGRITISNREIDDLIIVRPDGVPTYNFCVVVDDWDMNISHVFRGDEHVNNTPWQINIFNALGAPLPLFGHVPVILGDDGQKLSKRRGAVSVTSYEEAGFLPEAMLNYLARLGWSHGDEELFSREQIVQWFDGQHLSKSPAQWDAAKLAWVNAHYIKHTDDAVLAVLVSAQLQRRGNLGRTGRDTVPHVRLVQGPLRHDGRTGRLAGHVLRQRVAQRRRRGDACLGGGASRAARAARTSDPGRLEQGCPCCGHQAGSGRAFDQDAAVGPRSARDGLRARPNALSRRGAGALLPRNGARAFAAPLKSWL